MLANRAAFREDATTDFATEGLLDGLDADERPARERLLSQLAQDGFSTEQLARAVEEVRLAVLGVDRVLGGTRTANEIGAETGLPAALLIRARRLHGLPEPGPDDRVFTADDVEAAKSMKMFVNVGFEEEQIVEISRVLAEGMARLAATIRAAFVEVFLKAGEEDVAKRFATLTEELTPAAAPILIAAFRAHLRDSVERGMSRRTELAAGDVANEQDVAVCFADIVGFTRLGAGSRSRSSATVAGRLAQLAASVTEAPVRLIKTIGDAALFVSPQPGPLVEVALSLVDASRTRTFRACGPASPLARRCYTPATTTATR